MRIALVSCSKRKKAYPCQAKELYSASKLFSLSYQYAKKLADEVYILSAKHGLIKDTQSLEPYDLSLKDLSAKKQRDWADDVIKNLEQQFDLAHDEFLILAGKCYYQNLIPRINHYCLPLGNMRLGPRIQFLQEQLQAGNPEKCAAYRTEKETAATALHRLFSSMPRYGWQDIDKIPLQNGVYIMFEAGEVYHGFPRIVRVGTHTANGRLKKRLKNHFIREHKDSSILRKNVGKAILNRAKDPYLDIWALNTSRPENKALTDSQREAVLEAEVSRWLRDNISFTVFEAAEKENRLRLEEAIIAELYRTADFRPSDHWLGRFSPEREIRESGLWLKQGLNGEPLTGEELSRLLRQAAEKEKLSSDAGLGVRKEKKTGMDEIRSYIRTRLENARSLGKTSCVLVSGAIHKEMHLVGRMPSVCSAMYQIMGEKDKILHTTPSGKSSSITIEYYL